MEEIRKPEKRDMEESRTPTQKARSPHSKFKKWFLASTAATALIIGLSCGDHNETYIPIPPGNEQGDGGSSADGSVNADSGPDLDADIDTDSGTDLDGGPDLDADVDADTDSGTDLDGGPDLDADVDADTDSGTDLDGGPDLDADVDADTDSGTYVGCSGVYNDADYTVLMDGVTGHTTGGYTFYHVGYDSMSGDLTVDITCGSDIVRSGLVVPASTTLVTDITEDGKRVSISNLSANATTASVTLIVEDIPTSTPDGGVSDGGVSDGGVSDGGLVPACTGVTNGAMYTSLVFHGASVSVGGYVITNNGGDTSGITVDIDCGSDSSSVTSGISIPYGTTVVYDVPADGKTLSLTNIASNTVVASMTIIVSNL